MGLVLVNLELRSRDILWEFGDFIQIQIKVSCTNMFVHKSISK